MAPKSKGNREELKQEDVLQAVVIADSFNSRFAPVTQSKPRALLPVANVPMLDYTLEFLISAGVQEIYVFCSHLGDQIRTHIRNNWNERCRACLVTAILSEGCMSVGDALREIDAKSLIKSDFILVYGDVVANVKLQSLVEEHKKKRAKDKNTVMTMLLKKSPPGHSSRCHEDDVVMVIESDTNKVLHYQKTDDTKRLDIPVELLTNDKDIQLRYDLLDCQISICSPQVPILFADNFDYQTRDDFVKGVLIDAEIMSNSIFINVIKDEYAARISNLQMYDAVSRDVISRWTYPHVPDNIADDGVSYGRHNVYLSKDVTLARGCILEENVVVGSGTSIGSNSIISQSVIGKDCKIGNNVKITGSYIWDGITVDDNCDINMCLLCDNVHVYNDVVIHSGSVLSWDVKIGPDIELQSGSTLCSSPDDQSENFADVDLGDESKQDKEVTADYGSKGQAYLYKAPTDSDSEEDDHREQYRWGVSVVSDEEETSISSMSDQESSEPGSPPPEEDTMFYMETLDTLVRAREENIGSQNLILEINSLKHVYNIEIQELQGLVMKAVIDLPMRDEPDLEGTPLLSNMKKHLETHKALIKNYIKGKDSQQHCLYAIEDLSITETRLRSILMKLLHHMYDSDILSEEALVHWYKNIPETMEDDQEHQAVRKQVAPFIQWLEEAEEESSDED